MEQGKETADIKNAIIAIMADIVERRDNTTEGHISRISNYMKIFIDTLIESGEYKEQTSSWDVEQMILSAQLHDLGKIEIDDIILRKPGKLTDTEYEIMKRHTLLGGAIIKEIENKAGKSDFLDNAFLIAVNHHEKWDGTGYPKGAAGEEIPLSARLMAIIDVYDALVSERPYKKPFTHEEAVKIIGEATGSSFDPVLTNLFLSVSGKLIDAG